MLAKIIIQNLTNGKVPARFYRRAKVLLGAINKLTHIKINEISLAFVSPSVIRSLNRIYRRHNKVTDVLSFTYQVKPVIGELIICFLQAKQQAKREQVSFNNELERLFIHGCLHLAGYDHMKKKERQLMRALEDKILNT